MTDRAATMKRKGEGKGGQLSNHAVIYVIRETALMRTGGHGQAGWLIIPKDHGGYCAVGSRAEGDTLNLWTKPIHSVTVQDAHGGESKSAANLLIASSAATPDCQQCSRAWAAGENEAGLTGWVEGRGGAPDRMG